MITRGASKELVRRALALVTSQGHDYRDGLTTIYKENGLAIRLDHDAAPDVDGFAPSLGDFPTPIPTPRSLVFSIKVPRGKTGVVLSPSERANPAAAQALQILRKLAVLDDLAGL